MKYLLNAEAKDGMVIQLAASQTSPNLCYETGYANNYFFLIYHVLPPDRHPCIQWGSE